MPVPTSDPPDDFCAAALRFYDDATVLRGAGRHDGTVYLCGYVQECSLKASLKVSLPSFRGRDFGHELDSLNAPELCLQAVLRLKSRRGLEAAVTCGKEIDHQHPDRRYWPDHWSEADADRALADATTALQELIVRPMLDRGWALP